jgi:hypothetical protein
VLKNALNHKAGYNGLGVNIATFPNWVDEASVFKAGASFIHAVNERSVPEVAESSIRSPNIVMFWF